MNNWEISGNRTIGRNLKSFVISLGAHLVIGVLLTFTFIHPPRPAQPVFSFLGSFLGQQDVLSPIFHEDAGSYKTPIPLVSRRISRSKVNPIKLTAVSKPKEGTSLADSAKTYQKSFFAVSLPSPDGKTPELGTDDTNNDINLAVPRLNPTGLYRPLPR